MNWKSTSIIGEESFPYDSKRATMVVLRQMSSEFIVIFVPTKVSPLDLTYCAFYNSFIRGNLQDFFSLSITNAMFSAKRRVEWHLALVSRENC